MLIKNAFKIIICYAVQTIGNSPLSNEWNMKSRIVFSHCKFALGKIFIPLVFFSSRSVYRYESAKNTKI